MRVPNWMKLSLAPDFTIYALGAPYLRRWWVFIRNPIFNAYIHQFLSSDDPRACHDHPYWNVSIILKGSYIEWVLDKKSGGQTPHYRKARSIVIRPAKMAHRVQLIANNDGSDIPAWSLFITGPRLREWGFLCEGHRWVHWKIFTSNPADGKGSSFVGRGCDET